MKWYWEVRLYAPDGHYGHAVVATERQLVEIDIMQGVYRELTGCEMVIEGMSNSPPTEQVLTLNECFTLIWKGQFK